ncbi:glycosyltransferase family 39 protein [Leptolyngbya sp. FACHB-8]|nr:glycosyltransferase family 39 protein [Leptolyngbya sp. FACHB-8]MBD2155433.1 glycosyltransferase family 39 protein [Leptolyngbya sp. FACHB-16]
MLTPRSWGGRFPLWRPSRMLTRFWFVFLLVLLLLGFGLRWAQLDQRVFWVDEVATAVRIGGYTEAEVVAEVSDGHFRTPGDLRPYIQGPSPRSAQATLQALANSPEHAPLYFLIARQWTALFGRNPESLRSLSVILSLLALPAVYWLCWEWMCSSLAGWLAVGLMASSPLLIAYAQEARPYSLWVLLLVLSGGMLLRSLNTGKAHDWFGYSLSLSLCLYTSLLSIPLAIAQGIYLICLEKGRLTRTVRRGGLAIAASFVSFGPWLWIVVSRWDTLQSNTVWMQQPMGLVERIGIWIYTLSILVFDTPVAPLGTPLSNLQICTSIVILIAFAWAAMGLVRNTSPRIWGFVLALGLPTPLMLMLADLLLGGKRSTAPRYWIPTHVALILIVAGWLGVQAAYKYYPKDWNRRWQKIVAVLLAIALTCSIGNLWRSPRYLKTRNLHNPAIATLINQVPRPRVLAEPTEVYDLISLTQFLKPEVEIQVGEGDRLLQQLRPCQLDTFVLNPSPTLMEQFSSRPGALQEAYVPSRLTADEMALTLWRIVPPNTCSPN